MNYITFENKKYILGDIVIKDAPIYSKGCRSVRDLIKKKEIDKNKFIFARQIDGNWVISDGRSVKFDKVFFIQEFIDSIPELNKESDKEIVDDNGITKAPNIIYLKDEEKFKDDDGNVIEIETRGERDVDTAYFKVKDVMEGFNMLYLNDSITDKIGNYEYEKDYKYFLCEKEAKNGTCTKIKKELYLTYRGLLKVLFNTRDYCTKENNIVNNIKKYINHDWNCNKRLKCLYRPDMYTIINNNVFIIEIDENQHKKYDFELENERIQKIYKEFNRENMTIIRINPDAYMDSENNKHISIVNNINEFNDRMNIIINSIKQIIKNPEKGFNITYLFYNGYNKNININIKKYKCNYNINKNYERISQIRSNFIKNTFIFGKNTQKKYGECSYSAIQELFSINARDLPCVYLTAFNTVGVLRKEMNIDMKYKDDDIVYKFGLTKSFEVRKNGHKSEYKKIDNLIDMKLVQYTYIDPLYITEAENDIKNMLEEYKLNWENHDELVVIPNNMLKFINTLYTNIGMRYSGHTQEFMKKINDLELCISTLKKDQEYQKIIFEEKLINKDLIIDNKNHIIDNLKKDLRIKELELMLKKS
jgi:hypothetical protein